MPYTMEDFKLDYIKEHFPQLNSKQQQEVLQTMLPGEGEELLQSLPIEERLAGLSAEQIRQYLDQLSAKPRATPRKPRRKK